MGSAWNVPIVDDSNLHVQSCCFLYSVVTFYESHPVTHGRSGVAREAMW